MSQNGWIGVDLDGTLAFYDEWRGADHIGAPIPEMLERVKRWIAKGQNVKIFTARVSHDGTPRRIGEVLTARMAITEWCLEHIGRYLEITNVKDYAMIELWDDRAVQVEQNTGRLVGKLTRGL